MKIINNLSQLVRIELWHKSSCREEPFDRDVQGCEKKLKTASMTY